MKAYDRTTHDGKTVDWLTKAALMECEKRLGYPLTVVQGSYHAGVSASGGTHDAGGVIDLAPWDHERKVRVLREVGFAVWYRPELWQGGKRIWGSHVHAVLIGNDKLAPAAARQVTAYRNHRDGLAGNRVDNTWHPSPIPTFSLDAFEKAQAKAARVAKQRHGTLRVGTWNVERDRSPATVLAEVTRLSRDLDVLLLQETNGYGNLASVPDFRLVRFTAEKEQGETCILVRNGLEVGYARAEKVTTTGWRTVRGGRTAPKWATFARVNGCGFLSAHTPPTVQTLVKRLASPARWKSYGELMASIRRLAPTMPAPLVIAADWNVDAKTDAGKLADFPAATLAACKMTRAMPTTGTHGSRVIDGFGVKGATVTSLRVLSGYGSDHKPVVGVVTY